jgi:D-serine dehydratase
VLKTAEKVALTHGLLNHDESYAVLAESAAKELFCRHALAVGSTGNLGLSIGIIGAALGFRVTVHMSVEAREWKKARLRACGVKVVEHRGDYRLAVAEGRRQAAADPSCHFIDDESSRDLFLGYGVAARRLAGQLADLSIPVDADHPLAVYLPCGVGGGPGGIAFGLKLLFGAHVRCYFAEPTQAPCMLLGLATGLHDQVAVQDFGLSGETAADGLAVSRPSGLVGRICAPLIDGVYTVRDDHLFRCLALLVRSEALYLEPSATAGLPGPWRITAMVNAPNTPKNLVPAACHVVWATGGSMVPPAEMAAYYQRGQDLLAP